MFTERTIGGDSHRGTGDFSIDRFDLQDFEPRFIEEDFFGIREASAVECEDRVGASLDSARSDHIQPRISGDRGCSKDEEKNQAVDWFHDVWDWVCGRWSLGLAPILKTWNARTAADEFRPGDPVALGHHSQFQWAGRRVPSILCLRQSPGSDTSWWPSPESSEDHLRVHWLSNWMFRERGLL